MVSDKSQARSTGPIDSLTRQPVKGRKRGGGIRLGEMERDALLAHGISFCLHDRLLNCSDYSEGYVCKTCGNLLSSYSQVTMKKDDIMNQEISKVNFTGSRKYAYCRVCDGYDCHKVVVPWVLRYLTNELAAMNIKLTYALD